MLLNYHIGCIVLGLLCVGVRCSLARVVSGLPASAGSPDTSKLLKMDILMPETCSVSKK